MKECLRCGIKTDEIVETEKGFLCYGCDSHRLSCINNNDTEETEEDFWDNCKGVQN